MKFIRALMTLGLILFLSTVFIGCGGGSGGGDNAPSISNENPKDTNTDEDKIKTSEGSEDDPVEIKLDNAYSGKVGTSEDDAQISYYQFIAPESKVYEVTLTNPSSDDILRLSYYFGTSFYSTPYGSFVFTADSGVAYAFEVTNSSDMTNTTYTLTIAEATAKNEGSVEEPIELSIGTIHNGTVGVSDLDAQDSYYTFTTAEEGLYTVALSNDSVVRTIFSDSEYSDMVASATYGDLVARLKANTTYFLKINNAYPANEVYTISILYEAAPSQGTVSDPEVLEVATLYEGKTGVYESGEDYRDSYYTFTTSSQGFYNIAISDSSQYVYLYDDASFDDYFEVSYSDGMRVYLDANTTYYMKIYNSTSENATFDLSISGEGATNEGSESSPVSLTLESIHLAKTGVFDSGEDLRYSYYSFTTDSEGYYEINASDSSQWFYLYSDASFSDLEESDSSGELRLYLDANTTYYVEVYNSSSVDTAFNLSITEKGVTSEGSISSPVSLTLDEIHTAKTGQQESNHDSRSSYYSFTTGSEGYYGITVSAASQYIYLYSDASFDSYDDLKTAGKMIKYLNSGTTYYVKVRNVGSVNAIFDLKVENLGSVLNEGEAGNPVALSLDATHSAKVGIYDSVYGSSDYSYYSFTTGGASVYLITLLDTTSSDLLDFSLYSDVDFSNYLGSSNDATHTTATLAANTTYYMRVYNSDNSYQVSYDVTVMAPDANETITDDENISSQPVNIVADTEYFAHVSTSSGNGSSSYYSFETGDDTTAVIAFTNPSPSAELNLYLYSDSGYSNQVGTMIDSSPAVASSLDANTTYYIKVDNVNDADDVNYTLLLQFTP